MNIESNVSKISQQTSLFNNLSIIFLVLAIIFAIAAIVVWFVFKIPHSFRVITGIGAGREIQKIKTDTKSGVAPKSVDGNKAILTWNTSEIFNKKVDIVTESDGSEETMLLSDIEDADATQLLSEVEKEKVIDKNGFEIEEEIKFTGAEEIL